MDLNKNGRLLYNLRKTKGLTQKQVADMLGVVPKTVSKWETGKGLPDVSMLSNLADLFSASERTLLDGSLIKNNTDVGCIVGRCIFTAIKMDCLNIIYKMWYA